jgi:hypothetical protein
VVELCFDDLLNWNTWMYTRRREAPVGLLSWGSNPDPYTPDGSSEGSGSGGASLESGLDNGPVMNDVPFNQTGLYLQDEYDAGYSGMYLMDTLAQIELARSIGRADAATLLQSRFDEVSSAMMKTLWNDTAGYFQNKLSKDMAPVEHMAPTHFYPLLAGPEHGPTQDQVTTTVTQHLTNPARFAVWPTGEPPKEHPVPPEGARPLVQWRHDPKNKTVQPKHVLCCELICNFHQRAGSWHNVKMRYEGMGIASGYLPRARAGESRSIGTTGDIDDAHVPLFDWNCSDGDITLAPAGFNPSADLGGPCVLVNESANASLIVYTTKSGPSAADLVPLEMYYSSAAKDHYTAASEAGKADAISLGYQHVQTLGYVWPPPGTPNATSRYGLPAIAKDDPSYIDQNYWCGRTWSPMIQLVYWALEKYPTNKAAQGAAAGLVQQSRALLMKEWRGYGGQNSYAGSGRYVYENFGADTGEGYGYSSEAQPMYSWGALAGFIGLQANGFYDPLP